MDGRPDTPSYRDAKMHLKIKAALLSLTFGRHFGEFLYSLLVGEFTEFVEVGFVRQIGFGQLDQHLPDEVVRRRRTKIPHRHVQVRVLDLRPQ